MDDQRPLRPEAADIFKRLEQLGRKQVELAEALDLEPNKVSKMRSGERAFKAAELLAARAWLDQVEQLAKYEAQTETDQPRRRRLPERDDTVEILALDLSLSMGPGTLIEEFIEHEPIRLSLSLVQAITRTPSDRLRLVRGIGDSMEPTLRTSDLLMVDINERQLARMNGIYWIDHLGTHGIKRLRAISKGRVLIISDNPIVENFEVDADELLIHGRVIWLARDL